MKHRVALGTNDDVQVARGAAVGSGITFAREPDTLAVARAGFDSNFERLGFRDCAFTVAGWAHRKILAGTVAARALFGDLHASACLRNLAGAVALRTFSRSFERTLPMAVRANIAALNIQPHHAAPDRRPKGHVDLIFEVRTGRGTLLGCSGTAPTAEDSGKDVAETATGPGSSLCSPGVVDEIREIETAEIEWGALSLSCSRPSSGRKTAAKAPARTAGTRISLRRGGIDVVRVEADLVVDLPFLGIAKDFVGFGERLELFFRAFVPGIYIRMILTRELAESFANVLDGRGFFHAQDLVIIFFGSS